MAVVNMKQAKIKLSIGQIIDKMSVLRDERRAIAKQDEALKSEYDNFEVMLIDMMKAEGCPKASGKTASASISKNTVFNIADWDLFMAYLIKTKQGHLVQRRVSNPAVMEIFTSKGVVPGLEPFEKEGINLRNS